MSLNNSFLNSKYSSNSISNDSVVNLNLEGSLIEFTSLDAMFLDYEAAKDYATRSGWSRRRISLLSERQNDVGLAGFSYGGNHVVSQNL